MPPANYDTYVWTLLGPRARIEYIVVFCENEPQARNKALRLAKLDEDISRSARWVSFLMEGATPDIQTTDGILLG